MQVIDRPYILDRFSPSMINSYLDCPLSFYYQYIAKIKLPRKPQLVLGSAVHAGIENSFTGSIDPFKAFEQEYDKDSSEFSKEDNEEQKRIGRVLLQNFLHVKPEFDLTYNLSAGESEKRVLKKLENPVTGEVMEIPMSGIIDRLTNDDVIFEFKTASKKWDKDAANFRAQTLLYNLWFYSEKKRLPKETVYIIMLKNGKVGSEGIQILKSNHDIGDLACAFEEVEIILQKIKHGMFEKPAGWHPPWCDCKKYQELLDVN